MINANVDEQPEDIARRFVEEHEYDKKYLPVLTKLIDQ
jgi:hypothetical protein